MHECSNAAEIYSDQEWMWDWCYGMTCPATGWPCLPSMHLYWGLYGSERRRAILLNLLGYLGQSAAWRLDMYFLDIFHASIKV